MATFESKMPTPINLEVMRRLLEDYDNKDYILNGIEQGFHIGFEGPECATTCDNNKSVRDNLLETKFKIDHEVQLNRIEGPFKHIPFDNFKISPLALREKSNGKFRLLHNLSHPYDESAVNTNIPESASTVHYETINSAIKIIQKYKISYLAKSDIADAFRIIPIHPSCHHLLGFKFQEKFYYDKCLPQGCSSSCKIFEAFSDAIIWILKNKYGIKNVVKVLDDFLFIGKTKTEANKMLQDFYSMCNMINVATNCTQ